ncbi:MAG: NTP transferase domain-containing protein [Parcubacteria group bacterium]|nr:NTP transferase domain-containing protein [Parcubacteria group bacterium]
MKGIILAGGAGTRLSPLTKVTSKQLLPIYNKPMIYYPLETLMRGGITEILIITAPDRAGDFLRLLGSGRELGAKFTYEIQDKPEGIAQAFIIGENFVGDDSVALILGDNIFEDDFSQAIKGFKTGGHVFAKKVPDPERFGVVKFSSGGIAEQIVEKPKEHVSDYAVTGLYLYDNRVVAIAKNLKPSVRGELEITDVNNVYLQAGELAVSTVSGAWLDAGTFDSLLEANLLIAKREGSAVL